MRDIIPREERIKVADTNFRCQIWPGDDSHRPLLVCNGIGANLELLSPLAEHLAGRTLIFFDAPGIGGSSPPRYPYRPFMLARRVMRMLDKLGYGKVDVMGISWGGMLAQQLALQYPVRVKKVVLAATAPGVTMVPGKFGALSKMLSPKRYADRYFMVKNFETLYGDPYHIAADYARKLKRPTVRGYMAQMMALWGWTALPYLPLMRQPTLVLTGDNDNIVRVINGKLLAAFIRRSRLEIIEGGHLFILSNPEQTYPLIDEFLSA